MGRSRQLTDAFGECSSLGLVTYRMWSDGESISTFLAWALAFKNFECESVVYNSGDFIQRGHF